MTTRVRALTVDGNVWNIEVEGSSYIGGGSHRMARLLSLVFKSLGEVPTSRGPVFAVAQDLGELSDEDLRRLLEDSREAPGGVKAAMKRKDTSRGRQARRSRG